MEDRLRTGWREGVNRPAFILGNTSILTPPLVPEVKLHLAHEAVPMWQKTEDELGEIGLPPPFWAFAWAGGQALARHVLDHRELVLERSVVDLASGSGLVAIAAKLAGASRVLAADIDGFALSAVAINARLNDVELEITGEDLLSSDPPPADVILVGDLFYEKELAARCFAWLCKAQVHGARVLIGDPGRSYLPREQLQPVAEYSVPVTRDLEDAEIKRSAVWMIRNC